MNQDQKKVLRICRELEKKYRNDFAGWVNQYISFSGLKFQGLTDQQKEIADSLVESKNICVSAGGGLGKTALAALTVLWFLSTHPHAKIPTTAPTSKQLNDVLWAEIGMWIKRCKLQDLFVLRRGKLFIKGFDEWYAVARTVPKDGKNLNDTLAGFHAPYMMILVDEASGVPDPVFTALEGAMTDKNAYIFLISNPVSTGGYYYDTIADPDGKGADYKVLYYDSRDSPLVDAEYEQRILNRYGENSPMYKAKVLGQPISQTENATITPALYDKVISENREHSVGPVTLSIDVGGGGEDPTVFCHKEGNSVVRWDTLQTTEPDDITDYAISMFYRLWQGRPFTVVIDAAGIGWGPYHTLYKKAPFKVLGFVGQEKAFQAQMFRNRRTEGFFRLSREFENLHFPTDPPERLKKELVNIFFDYTKEPIEMEEKKKFRSRMGFSPDYADALMMGLAVSDMLALYASHRVPRNTTKAMDKLKIPDRTSKFGQFSKFIT